MKCKKMAVTPLQSIESPTSRDNDKARLVGPQPSPSAPDGGYGWVVLFAAFMCSALMDGISYTFGLFFVEFISTFHESQAKTAWIGSAFNGSYLFVGPLASLLGTRYGYRAVTMTGALLSTVTMVLSRYAYNVDMLILTYGIIGGTGFGLMYLPSIVMVGVYFDRRRAFATGVAVCGSGIGAFIFAPVFGGLLSVYDWQDVVLVVAALCMQGIVVGALFRPLTSGKATQNVSSNHATALEPHSQQEESNSTENKDSDKNKNKKSNTEDQNSTETGQGSDGIVILINYSTHVSIDGRVSQRCTAISPTAPPCDAMKSWSKNSISSSLPSDTTTETAQNIGLRLPTDSKAGLFVLNTHNRNIIQYGSTTCGTTRMETFERHLKRICRAGAAVLNRLFDKTLITDGVFLIYTLSASICMVGFYVPFVYLPGIAIQIGVSRADAAFLLSIIGIATTVSRVLAGWVTDRPWADCLVIYNISLLLTGVATILCPFVASYAVLSVYASLFGAAIAVFALLRSIIMVDLIGLDRLSNAFGILTMCQGLVAFVGSPIAGALFDFTHDSNSPFYLAGASLVLSGAMCMPLRRLVVSKRTTLNNTVVS